MNPLTRRLGITAILVASLLGVSHLLSRSESKGDRDVLSVAPLLNPLVHVRLMSLSGRADVRLEIDGHWLMRDGEDPTRIILPDRSSFIGKLSADSTGPQVGPYRSNLEHIILEPFGHEALRIDNSLYPGRLHVRVKRNAAGLALGLDLSLELPLEDYVLGVVCGEMATQRKGAQASLRAQAVAARTYALHKSGHRYALRDDTFNQVFLGLDYRTTQAQEAIDATRGLVMRWDGALVPAFFHRNCGGGTANALEAGFSKTTVEPLGGALEPACRSPRGLWERVVAANKLDALARRYQLGAWLRGIDTLQRDDSGRLLQVRLLGDEKHIDLAAEKLRAALSLPSMQLAEIEVRADGSAVFRGHGYGHGIGMCQEGALRMSREGTTFEQILQHYYPSAELIKLTSDLENLLSKHGS